MTLSCLATAASLVGYALAPEWWLMVVLGLLARPTDHDQRAHG